MKPIHILLVEDNEGDIFLTTEALLEGKITNRITVARDGKFAIDLLEDTAENDPSNLPDLVLLDINLPRMNGHEVLDVIKLSEQLKHIPVIILTTSSAEKDIVKSYHRYANCFISKPVEAENFLNVVKTIENFWISIVHLPTNSSMTN